MVEGGLHETDQKSKRENKKVVPQAVASSSSSSSSSSAVGKDPQKKELMKLDEEAEESSEVSEEKVEMWEDTIVDVQVRGGLDDVGKMLFDLFAGGTCKQFCIRQGRTWWWVLWYRLLKRICFLLSEAWNVFGCVVAVSHYSSYKQHLPVFYEATWIRGPSRDTV